MSTTGQYTPLGPGRFTVSDLVLTGFAFDSPAAGGTADEYVGAFTTPPTSLGAGTVQAGTYYHVDATAPTTSCGGRRLSLTWATPLSGLSVEYGNGLTAATVGGAVVSFASTQLGGTITFPLRFSGRMLPGERVMSDILPTGRFAVLTYISGPSNNNAPYFETFCGSPTRAGIGLHRISTSTTDQPIVFRIDFYDAVCAS